MHRLLDRFKQQRAPLIFIAGGIATACLTVGLLAIGSKGAEIATVLALPLGVIAILVPLIYKSPREEESPPDPPPPPEWPRGRWLILGTVVALAATFASVYWFFIHKRDLPVTDQVAVGGDGRDLHHNQTATLDIPGDPPERRHLALTLALINNAGTGDCVLPASLNIAVKADGQVLSTRDGRAGKELRLKLGEVARGAQILVTLSERDPACTVDLKVTEAVLYNEFWES